MQTLYRLIKKKKKASVELVKRIRSGLLDLNSWMWNDMEFETLDHFTPDGWDEVQFLISTNPGQPMRPLKDVASGGETLYYAGDQDGAGGFR